MDDIQTLEQLVGYQNGHGTDVTNRIGIGRFEFGV